MADLSAMDLDNAEQVAEPVATAATGASGDDSIMSPETEAAVGEMFAALRSQHEKLAVDRKLADAFEKRFTENGGWRSITDGAAENPEAARKFAEFYAARARSEYEAQPKKRAFDAYALTKNGVNASLLNAAFDPAQRRGKAYAAFAEFKTANPELFAAADAAAPALKGEPSKKYVEPKDRLIDGYTEHFTAHWNAMTGEETADPARVRDFARYYAEQIVQDYDRYDRKLPGTKSFYDHALAEDGVKPEILNRAFNPETGKGAAIKQYEAFKATPTAPAAASEIEEAAATLENPDAADDQPANKSKNADTLEADQNPDADSVEKPDAQAAKAEENTPAQDPAQNDEGADSHLAGLAMEPFRENKAGNLLFQPFLAYPRIGDRPDVAMAGSDWQALSPHTARLIAQYYGGIDQDAAFLAALDELAEQLPPEKLADGENPETDPDKIRDRRRARLLEQETLGIPGPDGKIARMNGQDAIFALFMRHSALAGHFDATQYGRPNAPEYGGNVLDAVMLFPKSGLNHAYNTLVHTTWSDQQTYGADLCFRDSQKTVYRISGKGIQARMPMNGRFNATTALHLAGIGIGMRLDNARQDGGEPNLKFCISLPKTLRPQEYAYRRDLILISTLLESKKAGINPQLQMKSRLGQRSDITHIDFGSLSEKAVTELQSLGLNVSDLVARFNSGSLSVGSAASLENVEENTSHPAKDRAPQGSTADKSGENQQAAPAQTDAPAKPTAQDVLAGGRSEIAVPETAPSVKPLGETGEGPHEPAEAPQLPSAALVQNGHGGPAAHKPRPMRPS
ncbi:MAG: hypothetical protein KDJ49_06580 [Alphaproteobacteria bacterium]|nr:hypothetical protein [Alphaproteobacteria bacterium]